MEQDSEDCLLNEYVNFKRQWEEGPVLLGRGLKKLGFGQITMGKVTQLLQPQFFICKMEMRICASQGCL